MLKNNLVVITNPIYFASQSTFMHNEEIKHSEELQHIKQMMEQSSRFISLSGLSGIAAGTCALVGAYFGNASILHSKAGVVEDLDTTLYDASVNGNFTLPNLLSNQLVQIAIVTFFSALVSTFIFTFIRSKRTKVSMWSTTSKRLFINMSIPLVIGGIFLLKLAMWGVVGLIAPGCLLFYGLALVNASKYTLNEVRYLGYSQLLLGIINLLFIGKGLLFWAIGFGLLHIIYGLVMWLKYEKQ